MSRVYHQLDLITGDALQPAREMKWIARPRRVGDPREPLTARIPRESLSSRRQTTEQGEERPFQPHAGYRSQTAQGLPDASHIRPDAVSLQHGQQCLATAGEDVNVMMPVHQRRRVSGQLDEAPILTVELMKQLGITDASGQQSSEKST
jgi:hypothetical protein